MEKTLFQGLLEQHCYQGRINLKNKARSKIDFEPREDNKKILSKPCTEHCGDCDDIVTGRIVEYTIKFDYLDRPVGWTKKCSLCKKKTVVKRIITK
jgi:hypothetical protein